VIARLEGLSWEELDARFPWIQAMRGCAQEAEYHAEGDVWIHAGMVLAALLRLERWPLLSEADRDILWWAALLHDVAKPRCSRVENGRITSRGHSAAGALDARRILWEMDAPFREREQVAAMVRHHQAPFYLVDRADCRRMAHEISQTARCDLLELLAEADARGRKCADRARLLQNVALFAEYCRDEACYHGPRLFANEWSRFLYFRTPGRDPDYAAYDETEFEVVLMSGLPGAGKDCWIRTHAPGLPMVSLDAIRRARKISPEQDQGPVVQEAREEARRLLRAKQGFVWNATNLSREIRRQCVDLFVSYGARVRIVYVEAPYQQWVAQNREREFPVRAAAVERMLERWEVPDVTEAHAVSYAAEWDRNADSKS
jgi:putative nucleotidyltransferase with HDIG domain